MEICSPLLARIVPELLDNSFRLALDPLFQPHFLNEDYLNERRRLRRIDQVQQLKYTLIFDELVDHTELEKLQHRAKKPAAEQLLAEVVEEELHAEQQQLLIAQEQAKLESRDASF